MQAIFFSNYLLIENFLDDCSQDVKDLSCGRLQTEANEEVPLPFDVYNSGLHNNEIHTPYDKCKFSFSSKAKISFQKELLKGQIDNSKQYIYKPSNEIISQMSHASNLKPKVRPRRCGLYRSGYGSLLIWRPQITLNHNHGNQIVFNIYVIYRVFLFRQRPVTFATFVELGCLSLSANDYSAALSFEKENPVVFIASFMVNRC